MASLKNIFKIVNKNKYPLIVGFFAAVGSFIVMEAAMKPVSTSEYCGTQCHEMNTAYQSWELSVHGTNERGLQTQCVDCHLPPKEKLFRHVVSKGIAGAKDTYMHYFGDDYDVEKMRKKVIEHFPSGRCMHCHEDLLAKPGSSAARMAHISAINDPGEGTRCVNCHENIGHERHKKIFSER